MEVCCFSSASLNETVPMAAVPSGAPSPSPPAVLSLIGWACFLLSDQVAGAAPSACLGNTIPSSLLRTHQPERFLSNDVFKFGGEGGGLLLKINLTQTRRRTAATKVFQPPNAAAALCEHRDVRFLRRRRAAGQEDVQSQDLRGRRGHRRIILEQNCGGQQLQLLSNLIASANHITERKPGAKVLRCYLFIRWVLCR